MTPCSPHPQHPVSFSSHLSVQQEHPSIPLVIDCCGFIIKITYNIQFNKAHITHSRYCRRDELNKFSKEFTEYLWKFAKLKFLFTSGVTPFSSAFICVKFSSNPTQKCSSCYYLWERDFLAIFKASTLFFVEFSVQYILCGG